MAGQASGVSGTTSAYLNQPGYIVVDANNNLYVTDCMNHRVQFWSSSGSAGVTVAGTGELNRKAADPSTRGHCCYRTSTNFNISSNVTWSLKIGKNQLEDYISF